MGRIRWLGVERPAAVSAPKRRRSTVRREARVRCRAHGPSRATGCVCWRGAVSIMVPTPVPIRAPDTGWPVAKPTPV